MKVEAVIFDLGRVLIDVDFTRGLFPYLDGQSGKDDQTILKEVFKNPLFRNYSMGKISTDTLYQEFKSIFRLDLGFERFSQLWCDVFTPMKGMDEIVERVARRFKTGILSDTDPLHWEFVLKEYPILQHIPYRTLSFEIGALKPDPICYKMAARNVGTPMESCLFIDDRDINIAGAVEAGMQAIRFIDINQIQSDLNARGIL